MINEHEIKTIGDILNVITPENIDNFLIDFRGFLTLNMTVKMAQDIVGKDAEIGMKEKGVMHWIDDGKTDTHIHIKVGGSK